MNEKIYSVSELTFAIKAQLESSFRYIKIQGEISNFKKQSSGHMYFSLKDKNAQIQVALFRGNAQYLKKLPKDGDHIIIRGEISVYPPRGNYQIIARELDFIGVGELLVKLHELKKKIQDLGWTDQKHKKTLPKIPKVIGVITSPTGAAIQDILHVLNRRFSTFQLLLNPVKVQGEGSAEEISKAVYEFNTYQLADILIVGRGGGSLEDLWAFNEEIVAKAIFESKIPIISAVGHETDLSIADLVADIRAPTPSAAAEIAVSEKEQCINQLHSFRRQTVRILNSHIKEFKKGLIGFRKHPFFSSPYALLSTPLQRFDEIKYKLDNAFLTHLNQIYFNLDSVKKRLKVLNPISSIQNQKKALSDYKSRLNNACTNFFYAKRDKFQKKSIFISFDKSIKKFIQLNNEKLNFFKIHFSNLDPNHLLKRGYSILFSEKDNSIILSTKQIKQDQAVTAQLSDGKVRLKAEGLCKKN